MKILGSTHLILWVCIIFFFPETEYHSQAEMHVKFLLKKKKVQRCLMLLYPKIISRVRDKNPFGRYKSVKISSWLVALVLCLGPLSYSPDTQLCLQIYHSQVFSYTMQFSEDRLCYYYLKPLGFYFWRLNTEDQACSIFYQRVTVAVYMIKFLCQKH